jgi:hypothetical protein
MKRSAKGLTSGFGVGSRKKQLVEHINECFWRKMVNKRRQMALVHLDPIGILATGLLMFGEIRCELILKLYIFFYS